MEEKYPDWSIIDYFKGAVSFVGYSVNQPGDFWLKLGALFMALALSGLFIPASIAWFIIKNKGQVGGLTWTLVIFSLFVGFLWLTLA